MTHSMATTGGPSLPPAGLAGCSWTPQCGHAIIPSFISTSQRFMLWKANGYWEGFGPPRVLRRVLSFTCHFSSASIDKMKTWRFCNMNIRYCKWVRKYRFSTIFSTRHSIIYKTMEKIHCIEHHATLMVPEISKQIQSWDTLYPRPQSRHNHHFKIHLN